MIQSDHPVAIGFYNEVEKTAFLGAALRIGGAALKKIGPSVAKAVKSPAARQVATDVGVSAGMNAMSRPKAQAPSTEMSA